MQRIWLGPAGTPSVTDGGTIEAIDDLEKLGLDAMEVQFTYGVRMGADLAEEIGRKAKNKIHLSVHAPYYINLCSSEPEKVKASKQRIIDSAIRAGSMLADVVTFHPAYYGKLGDKAFDQVLAECSDIISSLHEKGIKVSLGLETTGRKSQFGTLEEIIEICKKQKKCVPVVDFSHLFARAGGVIDYSDIFDKLRALKLNHLHCHFSGIEFGPSGERKHLSMGNPPFEPLAREIIKRKVNMVIISESPLLEQDSLRMKSIFEKLGHKFR